MIVKNEKRKLHEETFCAKNQYVPPQSLSFDVNCTKGTISRQIRSDTGKHCTPTSFRTDVKYSVLSIVEDEPVGNKLVQKGSWFRVRHAIVGVASAQLSLQVLCAKLIVQNNIVLNFFIKYAPRKLTFLHSIGLNLNFALLILTNVES